MQGMWGRPSKLLPLPSSPLLSETPDAGSHASAGEDERQSPRFCQLRRSSPGDPAQSRSLPQLGSAALPRLQCGPSPEARSGSRVTDFCVSIGQRRSASFRSAGSVTQDDTVPSEGLPLQEWGPWESHGGLEPPLAWLRSSAKSSSHWAHSSGRATAKGGLR